MKAVQVPTAHDLQIIEQERPTIKENDEVLVKVKRVGICGSDMHIYHGTNPLATYPRIVGHEVAGEVVEVGSSVETLQVGDHVVVEPINYCGECYACRKGRPNVCEKLSVFGVHEDGGMREYAVLPEKQLHAVSKELSWDEIVLAEPYTIGAQAVWRGNVEAGDTVLIQGCGPIGICILKLAKIAGATVYMTDLSEERMAFAKESGADVVINAGKESVKDRILELTNGGGPNVVIDAVGMPATVELSIDLVSPAGYVVVLGFDERPSAIPQLPITKKEVTIVGSRLQTNQFGKVVELMNSGELKSDGLTTHKFALADVQEAFTFVEKNPDKVRKALVVFE
ncbi:zinc-binding alcohol dehydrogenase family protein [Planomicrobium sp. CPCC 101079]|uniref:zinc-binding alcohol dehydrogenase family protein n=1 Tax=Planomicrobium sp. CPCC 101079 TaxID=2599618 RepID=UPI0011B63A4D|nr:zinc-binding alcohol dehydrogenase family protein [Planomicrobium sp. CPCC 101079]TWT04922.1 zinc-binding alcohol dehydrogenase family protein [Planomicrobium sp. CPCC 101079]